MPRIPKARQNQVVLSHLSQYQQCVGVDAKECCISELAIQINLHPEEGGCIHLQLTVDAFRQLQTQFEAVAQRLSIEQLPLF